MGGAWGHLGLPPRPVESPIPERRRHYRRVPRANRSTGVVPTEDQEEEEAMFSNRVIPPNADPKLKGPDVHTRALTSTSAIIGARRQLETVMSDTLTLYLGGVPAPKKAK